MAGSLRRLHSLLPETVQKLRSILLENNLKVMAISAHYNMAYEYVNKLHWWDNSRSGGPIVEQATHFLDLMRYIASVSSGEKATPDPHSMQALTVEHDEQVGILGKLNIDESMLDPDNRIPRVASAQFIFANNGVIGNLTHVVGLHGATLYDTHIEATADGWIFSLRNLYAERPQL